MRDRILTKLDWASPTVDFRALDDTRLCAIHDWVETQLGERGHCHVPVSGRVDKERRLGRTNKPCWRYVAYVVGAQGETHEVAVCSTRCDAYDALRRNRAIYWYEHVRQAQEAQAQAEKGDPPCPPRTQPAT